MNKGFYAALIAVLMVLGLCHNSLAMRQGAQFTQVVYTADDYGHNGYYGSTDALPVTQENKSKMTELSYEARQLEKRRQNNVRKLAVMRGVLNLKKSIGSRLQTVYVSQWPEQVSWGYRYAWDVQTESHHCMGKLNTRDNRTYTLDEEYYCLNK